MPSSTKYGIPCIDLGTTYVAGCVYNLEKQMVDVILLNGNETTLPSVVAVNKTNYMETFTGNQAKKKIGNKSYEVVSQYKRLIGVL